jgi:hypothetical protein
VTYLFNNTLMILLSPQYFPVERIAGFGEDINILPGFSKSGSVGSIEVFTIWFR